MNITAMAFEIYIDKTSVYLGQHILLFLVYNKYDVIVTGYFVYQFSDKLYLKVWIEVVIFFSP